MKKTIEKTAKRARRHGRIRAKVLGTNKTPRLSVFKSTSNIYAQIIDDEKGVTIAAYDSRKSKEKTPLKRAQDTGAGIAKAAKAKKISDVVFDRGGFVYKGKVKALAEGAREGGLKF